MLLSSEDHPANVVAQDSEGRLPIHRAILLGYAEVADTLLVAMEFSEQEAESTGKSKKWTVRKEVEGDLTAAAIERPPDGTESFSEDFVRRLAQLETSHLHNSASLFHCWAGKDFASSFARGKEIHLQDIAGPVDKKDDKGMTPLDSAIKTNSSGIVEEFLKAGCQPTQIYLIENCSLRLRKILD